MNKGRLDCSRIYFTVKENKYYDWKGRDIEHPPRFFPVGYRWHVSKCSEFSSEAHNFRAKISDVNVNVFGVHLGYSC